MKIKRKAESSRKKGNRRTNPIIVIICEGKETEVNYFDYFNSKCTKVDVKIIDKKSRGKNKGKITDCENLVNRAIYYKKSKYDINEKDGDRVWCIVDTDVNYKNPNGQHSKIAEFQKAQTIASRNKIRLGISNPCFELWYFLHFKYTTAYLRDYEAVRRKLKRETPIVDYEKSQDICELLKDNIKKAIDNGRRLEKFHNKNGKKLVNVEYDLSNLNVKDVVESNPYTNIMDLIEYIEELNKK